jgi:hypothetical protein
VEIDRGEGAAVMIQPTLFAVDDPAIIEIQLLWKEALASLEEHGSVEEIVRANWARVVASDPARWADLALPWESADAS